MSDIDSVYINFWGKQKPEFTAMEVALMEGGHSLEKPATMSFIKSLSKPVKDTWQTLPSKPQ